MSSKIERKENREPLIVEVLEYDNLQNILPKMIVPFSKFERVSNAPDLYSGSETIPFEARDPLFKNAMKQEFAKAMRFYRIQRRALHSLFL
jgi:hypothetical protein